MAVDKKFLIGYGVFYSSYLFILNTFAFLGVGDIPGYRSLNGWGGFNIIKGMGFGTFGPSTPAALTFFSGFLFLVGIAIVIELYRSG